MRSARLGAKGVGEVSYGGGTADDHECRGGTRWHTRNGDAYGYSDYAGSRLGGTQ